MYKVTVDEDVLVPQVTTLVGAEVDKSPSVLDLPCEGGDEDVVMENGRESEANAFARFELDFFKTCCSGEVENGVVGLEVINAFPLSPDPTCIFIPKSCLTRDR